MSTQEAVLSGTIEFEDEKNDNHVEEEDDDDDKKVIAWKLPSKLRPSDWLLRSVEEDAVKDVENAESGDDNTRVSSGNVFDPFCTGQNCYAQMFFKLLGSTISDIGIDADAVAIHPIPTKRLRIKVEKQIFGIEYLVWNSLGDARYIRRPTFGEEKEEEEPLKT